MDTFESAIKLVTSKSFMASIDLRHAYYSVPIAEEHQKFLRFYWNGKLFQYTCLPNGISSAPRIFTKLLKPVYSSLRVLGHVNVGYIDDSLLLGETIEECNKNMKGDLEWWVANVSTELRHISHGSPQIVIQTDASLLGWGGILSDNEIGVCLFVSSFQFIEPVHFQNQRGRCKRSSNSSILADTNLVSETNAVVNRQSNRSSKEQEDFESSSRSTICSSFTQENETNCMSSVRSSFRERGFSKETTHILMSSWKSSTKKQYQVYIRKWFKYCNKKQINCFQISVGTVLEFFTTLFKEGNLGYSSLNLARGALSSLGLTIDSIPVGRHAMVIRYMKGIFNLRQPRPRYESTWDVSKVLQFLRSLSPVKYLKLKDLTLKLTMLIALTNAARAQSIHFMNVNHVHKVKGEFIFVLNELVKQSRPGYKEPTVNIKAYPPDRRLCVYTVYKEYVFRTKLFRGKHEPLLLSYVKPHQPVSRDTISRWIKVVIAKANIDTTIFKAHSVRSASVSKAKMNAVPISRILQKAGWSDAKTFAKFYNKKIEKDENSFSFNVLKN
ncbi:uncharacterized protein [Mytilus edulis]|uniref:uncharacterized protein n=1 Tax=Mytilus edulis TaxID=6550 RepID=UPI0039EF68C9